MPTIKDSVRFNFNGVWSDSFNIMSVVLDNSMYEETFVADRNLIETKTRGSNKPLLHGVEEDTLKFPLSIAFIGKFDDVLLDGIIDWLFVDSYKPLYFEGKEDRVYMCMPFESSNIIHNGMKEGYITLNMRCDSSHLYSQVITTPISTISTMDIVTIINDGHVVVYPEVSILKNGAGTVSIENLSDGGSILDIHNLTDQEDIYLDSKREVIETDITGVYRYDDIIGYFPRLVKGENKIKITGACTIQFRYKKEYKF